MAPKLFLKARARVSLCYVFLFEYVLYRSFCLIHTRLLLYFYNTSLIPVTKNEKKNISMKTDAFEYFFFHFKLKITHGATSRMF